MKNKYKIIYCYPKIKGVNKNE